jgi:ceramide glucosyltransferase
VLLALTFAIRLAVGFVAAVTVVHDHQMLRYIFLLPLRDLIAPLVWAASFMGNRIHWRGDVFDLKDGRLSKIRIRASL